MGGGGGGGAAHIKVGYISYIMSDMRPRCVVKNVEDTVDLDEELRQNCEELENKNSKHGRKNSFLRQNKVTNLV